jgi:hypothetical protein
MKCWKRQVLSVLLAVTFLACGESDTPVPEPEVPAVTDPAPDPVTDAADFSCQVDQPYPYAESVPYGSIHGGPGNNDWIPCTLAPDFGQSWHALKGHGVAQPNTFSPDGSVTYVTSSKPTPDACTLHAVSTADGTVVWCHAYEGAIWSAVEVDLDGHLYVATGTTVVSLTPDGEERWVTPTPAHPYGDNGAVGLHFTPDGHIATVTNHGTALLLARADGAILASLDLPGAFGFDVPPPPVDELSLMDLLPQAVLDDFAMLQTGDPSALLDVFSGTGNFSDNTVAVAPSGDLYVVGGGPTMGTSAVMQVRVDGPPDAPTLSPGWHGQLEQSSAASPAVSPDGSTLKVADGNSMPNFLDPASASAHLRLFDIADCDANTDGDPHPDLCTPELSVPLATGPIMGTTPMLDDGIHYVYETQFSEILDDTSVDLRAFDGDTLLWETRLPDGLQWTSVITVTDHHLVGTATRFTPSDTAIFTVELPRTAASELVLVDRQTGVLTFRAPITDDASSTVTVGPDGSLYVTLLSLLHTMSMETDPVAGVIRFTPQAAL